MLVSARIRQQNGVGMIEVLVTLIIVAVGLLGLAGLQTRAQTAEREAYQRAQALILVEDMASRIRSNREAARCYPTDSYIGTGNDPAACSGWGDSETRALADSDLNDWDQLLEGSAETIGGKSVGAMTGARGCITYDGTADPPQYTVTVAWQGEAATVAPTSNCASGEYGTDDRLRRVVQTTIAFATLGK